MMSLTKPSRTAMEAVLKKLDGVELSYQFEGCTAASSTPNGFNRDSARCWLGTGEAAWTAAVEAFRQWKMMPAEMVEVFAPGSIEVGLCVGVLFHGLGTWTFNPCRILKLHDEGTAAATTFGFTYGTLPGHVEKGEERFLLTWDHSTDQVWYDIEAVSRPNHILAWLAYPYARQQQAKFRLKSGQSMLAAVAEQAIATNMSTQVASVVE